MEFVILITYAIGALITFFIMYCVACKEYKKSNSHLKFEFWYKEECSTLHSIYTISWPFSIPILIILYIVRKIQDKINKLYGI
jgi:hypothetical protein